MNEKSRWKSFFHDPDISLPVVGRRITERMLDLLLWYGRIVRTGGRYFLHSNVPRSRWGYYSAVRRLRKNGLIAERALNGVAVLELTSAGADRTMDLLKPERFWRRRWRGVWNVLVYDVPEKRRDIRDALRAFLERKRLGCLQRSVWVSPDDIRPDYDDLVQTVGIQSVAYLFEARNVLCRSEEDIVTEAWDFLRLSELQDWYCEVCKHNVSLLAERAISDEELPAVACEEMSAFIGAMKEDPLLPHDLLPPGYGGFEVLKLHREFVGMARRGLQETGIAVE